MIFLQVMIQMNQLTCAANEIVQPDGNGVQVNRTIVAYRNGCSVMGKMIVPEMKTPKELERKSRLFRSVYSIYLVFRIIN